MGVAKTGAILSMRLWAPPLQYLRYPAMHIRLTRKFARVLNGLDLRAFSVGDVIELEDRFGHMLLREGWAELVPPVTDNRRGSPIARRKIDPTPES